MKYFIIFFTLIFSACSETKNNSENNSQLTPPPPSNLQIQLNAAELTAMQNSYCVAIQPFHWEIGNSQNLLIKGSLGAVSDNDEIAIASASKWIWSAYVLEKRLGSLSLSEKRGLMMTSGNFGFDLGACASTQTVFDCLNAGDITYDPAQIDKFNYDSAHMQISAVNDLGLGTFNKTELANEINSILGTSIKVNQPLLAGGFKASAQSYRQFLQKILKSQLRISQFLGKDKICTNPPACNNWNYSYGHWVEDTGDGAYSSAGLYGFYPWISSNKEYYGIISRYKFSSNAFIESALCGERIRKAFFTGIKQ